MAHELTRDVSEYRDAYSRDGVVMIPGALNEHWLGELRDAVEVQVAKGIRYFANRNMREEPGGFQEFCLHSGIGRLVADRLGGRLIDNHLMLDAARARLEVGRGAP